MSDKTKQEDGCFVSVGPVATDKSFGYIEDGVVIVTHLSEQQARRAAQVCANITGRPVTLTGPIETLEPEEEAK